MADEAEVKQLLDLGKECTTNTADQIITHPEWGIINFEAARGRLEKVHTIIHQFGRLPVGLLPNSIIQQIISTLQPLKDSLDQIRDFSIEQENPIKARDTLVMQYCDQADRFFGAALLYNCLSCVLEGRRSEDYNCLACILEK